MKPFQSFNSIKAVIYSRAFSDYQVSLKRLCSLKALDPGNRQFYTLCRISVSCGAGHNTCHFLSMQQGKSAVQLSCHPQAKEVAYLPSDSVVSLPKLSESSCLLGSPCICHPLSHAPIPFLAKRKTPLLNDRLAIHRQAPTWKLQTSQQMS